MSVEPVAVARPAGRRLSTLESIGVEELRGVGPRKASALGEMRISTVLDLLTHYPYRWIDRSRIVDIAALVPGEDAGASGTVVRADLRRLRNRKTMVTVLVEDETGRLGLTFFNQPWRSRQLREGTGVAVFGKVDLYRGARQMANPEVRLVGDETGRVVPVYRQSEKAGVTSNEIRHFMAEALERAGTFAEPLSEATLSRYRLVDRTAAFRSIHAPETYGEQEPAIRRLAFDELFRLQLQLVLRRRALEASLRGITHDVAAATGDGLVARFRADLPFTLTDAQERAFDEIAADLARPVPMHRLLQGDVGSGKTVVALATLLVGVDGGYQGALMVPTEVLAEQHYLLARRLVRGLRVPDPERLDGERPLVVALLTSRTPQARRTKLLAALRAGRVDVVVGTHALLTGDVGFSRLGVVVIDEQHRFGVDQRAALREKGTGEGAATVDPDVLVMTATPIPRTAAMTVYGDLDQSVVDELPLGRAPIATSVLAAEEEDRAWKAVMAAVAEGHQAFVVCPLVRPGAFETADDDVPDDEDDADGLLFSEDDRPRRPPRSAEEERERLASGPLAGARVGLLHGQLPPRDKEAQMDAFRNGSLDVLVATTVIEVGVDVPNATVMVIEDADRFGIAQLHQLRGRVGRGSVAARCYLIADRPSDDGVQRLDALARSTDGFELAEIDLELRGGGTVLGIRQKGRSDLKLATLRRDQRDLIDDARAVATSVIDDDPDLSRHELLRDELDALLGEKGEYLHRS